MAKFGKKTISEYPAQGKDLVDLIKKAKNTLEEHINGLESDYREAKNSLQHARERYNAVEKSVFETEQQLRNTISRESRNILAELDRKREESSNAIRNTNARIEEEQKNVAENEEQYRVAIDTLQETMDSVLKLVVAELDDDLRLFEADLENSRTEVKDNADEQLKLTGILADKVSQIPETVHFECEEVLDELLRAEKTWLEKIDATDQELKEKENELEALENRIFVLNRATKIERVNSDISALRQDKQDLMVELEEIHQFMLDALYCEKPEECNTLFRAVAPYLDEKILIPECLLEQEHGINEDRHRIAFLKNQEQVLGEAVRFYEEAVHGLEGLIRKCGKSVTADTLPGFLKDASDFLKDPNNYLDMIRPLRTAVREQKSKIEESTALIKKLQKQAKESQVILDLFERTKDIENEEITVDNYETILSDIADTLPETKTYLSRIRDQERRLRTERAALPELESICTSAENRLRQTEGLKIDKDTLDAFHSIKTKTEKLGPKDIYQATVSNLFDPLNDQVEERFRNVFQRAGGTHRYDLYLLLRFAMLFYGRTTGEARIICIDEGQDITPNEYRMMQEVNGNQAVFNVFGDTLQLLKPNRGISDWQTVAEILHGAERYILNENYRNTNQITQYCNAYFQMDVQQTGADGREVKEIDRRYLEKYLSEFSSEENRCAVILPRAVKKDTYIERNQLPENIRGVIGNGIGRGLIAIVYVDEVKGVEFDSVFVVPNGMTRNEKYIAFTRALSELTVVIDNAIPPVSDVILKEVVESEGKNKQEQQRLHAYEGIAVGKVVKRKMHSGIKTG